MEAEAEILQPMELHFQDLLLLSSSSLTTTTSTSSSTCSSEELGRLKSILRAVMETLGPSGPGLLCVTGVPKADQLRQRLLPIARSLALLSNEDRRRVLKDQSLGSDVSLKNPDRSVSSFALKLKYARDLDPELFSNGFAHNVENCDITKEEHQDPNELNGLSHNEFKILEDTIEELGLCMMDIGLLLAQVCDEAIGGHELEQSIRDSGTAKGRLIHYHSALDNLILKEDRKAKCPRQRTSEGPRKGTTTKSFLHPLENGPIPVEETNLEYNESGVTSCRASISHLWQQWHYDYGIFTVLTSPMFISSTKASNGFCISSKQERIPPNGHSYLQIFDPNRNKILVVQTPPDSFIVQVGESADILSKGKLRATLHSVSRPVKENWSRETLVVFLQPAWGKTLSISEDLICRENSHKNVQPSFDKHDLSQEIHRMVPPLSSRFKDGMTFSEFSRETTKQYYGGNGVQSQK